MTIQTQPALAGILDGLMRRYQERVPDVSTIIQCMIDEGLIQEASDIQNDHIAFRTMGVDNLGIASLEKIFLHHGYSRRDRYDFASKKLNAYWYSPPSPELPRIFISELRVSDLPENIQAIIHTYTDEVTSDPVDALNLDDAAVVDTFLHSGLWHLPTLADYEALAAASEYAAWVIYNRYYLNHFTVTIHNLPDGYNTIATFNDFLEARGFKLNDAGGKIKTSNDGKLIQSSTVAEMITATFAGGDSKEISGSYVEFAERRPLADFENVVISELTRDMRREGFEAANADKIFESTYSSQTSQRA